MEQRTYRRHSPEFKLEVCAEIRSGRIGRRQAQRAFDLSDNLLHRWLAEFDGGRLTKPSSALEPGGKSALARIAALEAKVECLLMAISNRQEQTATASSVVRRARKKCALSCLRA